MKRKKDDSAKKITAGFIAGAIAGAIAGILLAPKKGKELRADLKKKADEISKNVVKKAERVGKLSKKKYEEIVEEAAKVYEKARNIKKEDIKEIVKHLKSKWPEIEKKIQKRGK